MIFLQDNILLERQLTSDDIKNRLLGHWGTCPGLVLVYAHLNRLIRKDGLDVLYVVGPGLCALVPAKFVLTHYIFPRSRRSCYFVLPLARKLLGTVYARVHSRQSRPDKAHIRIQRSRRFPQVMFILPFTSYFSAL